MLICTLWWWGSCFTYIVHHYKYVCELKTELIKLRRFNLCAKWGRKFSIYVRFYIYYIWHVCAKYSNNRLLLCPYVQFVIIICNSMSYYIWIGFASNFFNIFFSQLRVSNKFGFIFWNLAIYFHIKLNRTENIEYTELINPFCVHHLTVNVEKKQSFMFDRFLLHTLIGNAFAFIKVNGRWTQRTQIPIPYNTRIRRLTRSMWTHANQS